MSKIYKVVFAASARKDLKEIVRFFKNEAQEINIAKRQIAKIKEAVFALAQMPYRHEAVKDEYLKSKGMYKLPIDNYMVIYIVSEEKNTVEIVRVINQRRDWINLI